MVACPAGSGVPQQKVTVCDDADFGGCRFMESFEARHSNHSFTARLASAVGVTAPPLRLDSQAKYGACVRAETARLHASGLLAWRLCFE